MTGNIDAILFDMGGTLRRATAREFSEKVILCKQIMELTGFDSDPEQFARLLDTRANAYRKWSKQELAELNEIGFWTQWMLPELAAEKVGAIAVKLNQIWRDADRVYQVLPDAKDTILGLFRAGYRLGLVSNTTSSVEAPNLLEQLGVAGCFEAVVLSCQMGIRKPRPEILLEATRRMELQPERCAYIGNLPDRDVASARSAGFSQTVILRDPLKPFDLPDDPALMPDHFIDQLQELLALFPPHSSRKGPSASGRVYDISLSTMWGMKKFAAISDFFLAAPRLGFAGIELNHQVRPEMLAGIDLKEHRIGSVHEPCPAVIPTDVLKKQDLLISSTDEERRREGVNSIKRSIDLASELGSGTVVVHCGQLPGDWSIEQELRELFDKNQAGSQEYRELKDRFIERRSTVIAPHLAAVKKSLIELLEYSGPLKVRLGIENRYHYFDIPTLDEMAEILELADPDRIGFLYDVGHAQTQDRLGFCPHESWLEHFSARILGAHLHDVVGISDHRVPGLGEVDFRRVASHLPVRAFRTLEVSGAATPEQIRLGLKTLAETGCVNLIQ